MRKKKKELQLEEEQNQINRTEEVEFLKKRTIKELIAPAGIDASKIDHLEIISLYFLCIGLLLVLLRLRKIFYLIHLKYFRVSLR